MYMTAPTPMVQPLSSDAACAAMRTSVDCLLEACSLRHMVDFRAVMLLAEHTLVSCDLAIVRGAIYLLILPPLVADEDELPDWSPTPRRFAQQLHLPFSLTSQVLAMLSFSCSVCMKHWARFIVVMLAEVSVGSASGSS